MKLLICALLLACQASAQTTSFVCDESPKPEIHLTTAKVAWKMDKNRWITGSLIVLAGASKGFNETLLFHWRVFERKFPGANAQWFNPEISWRNKYRDGNPNNGERYPLSTNLLVVGTDQYHLNNFINRSCWITAMVIKLGEGKKSWKYYLKDLLFYSACNQVGFAAVYYPFRYNKRKP